VSKRMTVFGRAADKSRPTGVTSARNRRRLEAKAQRKFDEAVRGNHPFKDMPVEVIPHDDGTRTLLWGIGTKLYGSQANEAGEIES
jgi:hypothetical protein